MTLKHDFLETDIRQSRPRLTRAAVLVQIVLVFLGVALILTAGREVATDQTPLRAAMVTQVPAANSSPLAAKPALSPTPFVCPADPAEWTVRMAPGLTGQQIGKVDPPCVADEALTDLQDAVRWYYETPDRNPADAYRYFADDPLASLAGLMSTTVTSLRSAGQDFRIVVSPADRLTYVGGFAPDAAGKQVSVRDHCPGGSVFQTYDRETGDVISSESHPAHVMVFTMTYDESDRRWKIGRMEEHALDARGDPQLLRQVIQDLYGDTPISTPEDK